MLHDPNNQKFEGALEELDFETGDPLLVLMKGHLVEVSELEQHRQAHHEECSAEGIY
jgi:hypothetical protein